MTQFTAPLFETHSHTTLCRHAQGSTDEYAEMAVSKGLDGIIFTCHCPLPDGISPSVRMYDSDWPDYVDRIAQTREKYAGQLDVRMGLESDYLPGLEPRLEALHAREPLHYVLGSVHPQLQDYKDLYFRDDWPAFQRQYFTSLAEAAETGLFDCISHPDLVKNLAPDAYDLPELLDHIRAMLDRIAETGIAMELNTSGLNKTVPEMNPGPEILKEMRQRDIPVVVGADVHVTERVAAEFPLAYDLLEQAGYTEITVFLDRTPHTTPLDAARSKLKP